MSEDDILETPGFSGASVVSVVVVAFAAGSALGVYFTNKRVKAKYEQIASDEIREARDKYAKRAKSESYSDPETLAEKYEDSDRAKDEAGYTEIVDAMEYNKVFTRPEPDLKPLAQNIFDQGLSEEEIEAAEQVAKFQSDDPDTYFDWEEELERRKKDHFKPFVITQEEYMQDEKEFQHETLTYYDGDDVLADSKDEPINDLDKTVGYENILRFGHASGDPNIVYIRNNLLEMDIELVKSEGKFAEEVMGFVEHEDRPRGLRKFRNYD